MPIIQVEILKGRTREQKAKMVAGITEVVSEALNCPKEAVEIVIREMDPGDFAVGGTLWSDRNR